MVPASGAHGVGYYCGRFGPGLLGEPFNSFSNLAFVAGAVVAWKVWRSRKERDPWQLLLFALVASIGVGSFVFHSAPTRATLQIDLVPIQVFGLTCLAYICLRYLRTSVWVTAALAVGFFLFRQGWVAYAPRGALGGGITHIPSIFALLALGVALRARGQFLSRYLFTASAAYVAAVAVRSVDLYLCPSFPLGVHWLWHLLTAFTTSTLLFGVATVPPEHRA